MIINFKELDQNWLSSVLLNEKTFMSVTFIFVKWDMMICHLMSTEWEIVCLLIKKTLWPNYHLDLHWTLYGSWKLSHGLLHPSSSFLTHFWLHEKLNSSLLGLDVTKLTLIYYNLIWFCTSILLFFFHA